MWKNLGLKNLLFQGRAKFSLPLVLKRVTVSLTSPWYSKKGTTKVHYLSSCDAFPPHPIQKLPAVCCDNANANLPIGGIPACCPPIKPECISYFPKPGKSENRKVIGCSFLIHTL